MSAARIALVTCDLFPDLWDDDHPLRDALRARGAAVEAVSWDAPGVDWAAYDAVVLRSAWDYPPRRDAFVAWARTVPTLANPAGVVAWNTDKHYLGDLAAKGIPVIPTEYVEPGASWTPPDAGEWVVKPAVSAGSRDTARYTLPGRAAEARAHVGRLTGEGRTAMIQPYLSAVDSAGETAVLYLAGPDGGLAYSHAIRKGPLLDGPAGVPPEVYEEDIGARTPAPAELALAARVVAALPDGGAGLLYARIDLIPGPDGEPRLIELELTEPSLFLLHAPGAADRLADAILARVTPRRRAPGAGRARLPG